MNCSRILNIMVLLGFMVNYMLRVNYTIAVVDMVMVISDKQQNSTAEQSANFSTSHLNNTINVSTFEF